MEDDLKNKRVVNDLLVDIFNDILKVEHRAIESYTSVPLTMCEMHIIEAIGKASDRQMSDIARSLRITLPTLTVSVDRLEDKGFILRRRSNADRRRVEISLTREGLAAYEYHAQFHRRMIETLFEDFNIGKMPVLMESLTMLRDFFKCQVENFSKG